MNSDGGGKDMGDLRLESRRGLTLPERRRVQKQNGDAAVNTVVESRTDDEVGKRLEDIHMYKKRRHEGEAEGLTASRHQHRWRKKC